MKSNSRWRMLEGLTTLMIFTSLVPSVILAQDSVINIRLSYKAARAGRATAPKRERVIPLLVMTKLKTLYLTCNVGVLTILLGIIFQKPIKTLTMPRKSRWMMLRKGNNATVALPAAANPNIDGTPLTTGDEIGVFTPAGLCVGAAVWTAAQSAAISVWGDNDQTPAVDGIKAGEEMRYRIWRKATNSVHLQMSATYTQGDGKYAANGIYILSALSGVRTSARNDDGAAVVKEFILHTNYPNPFNPVTTIRYTLPQPGLVTLKIFNVAGQELATLVNQRQAVGEHTLQWHAENFPSGVYMYRLQAMGRIETKKMILTR